MPSDAGGEHDPGRGTQTDQPALPARHVAVHRARGFAEHVAVEAARGFHARQLSIQRAPFAAVVGQQFVEIAVVGHGHDCILARMRASA
jgi:hypothetical protein